MADVKQEGFLYTPAELAEILIKYHGIHSGYWALITGFQIHAINSRPSDQSESYPTAMIPLVQVGIQPVQKNNLIAINAAKVNPLPKKKVSKRKTPKRRFKENR